MIDLEKDLAQQCWKMVLSDPFYGFFLAEINKNFVGDDHVVNTASVGAHRSSCNVQLLINTTFWKGLTDDQKQFTLKHELCHIIFEHVYGEWDWLVGDEHMIANIAFDMFINQNLDYKCMPSWICLPSSYPNLNLKWNEGSEYYFKELTRAKNQKQQSAQKGENGGKGTSGDKKFDKDLENEENTQNWHKTWEEISKDLGDSEREMIKKQISQAIDSAVEEVQKSRGEIPAYLRSRIESITTKRPTVVSWKAMLRLFMGKSQLQEPYRTRKRENLRFPDSPANKTKQKQKIVFCIDESGSMSSHELEEANNELYHAWKAGASITVVHWDSMVHHVNEYNGKLEIHRYCAGGTLASSAINWVNEKRNQYDVCVIATDGYIENAPSKCSIPTLWLITSAGSMEFKHSGKKVKMEGSNG